MSNNYEFFWNGIYSQWYMADMIVDGVRYNCCEQYMMHKKALLFNDYEIAQKILDSNGPAHQKELGKRVSNFNRTIWDSNCMSIVYKGNLAKFTQHTDLMEKMLSTGNKVFVEASPYDQIWGIGMGENEEGIEDPTNWKGLNLLGWALVSVRDKIRTTIH